MSDLPVALALVLPPALLDAALKGTALLAVACLLALPLRRASAAARHLLWALTLAGLLALPVLSLLLPRWQLPFAASGEGQPAAEPAPVEPAQGEDPAEGLPVLRPRVVQHQPAPRTRPVEMASRAPALPRGARGVEPRPAPNDLAPPAPAEERGWGWIPVAYGAGVALSVGWLALGLLSLGLLRRGCRAVTDGPAAALAAEVAAELGVRRRVRLLQSQGRGIPMTWGVLRPVVLLPAEAASWPAERLRLVLLHELGHVRRWDCLTQLLGHLARALYWFHPLAWLALARLRAEQELACDDLVLGAGAEAADYAEQLLVVTAGLPADFFAPPVALAMGRAARLRARLAALLEPARDRRPVRRRGRALAAVLALGLLLPLAAARWQPAAAGPGGQGEGAPGQEQKKAPEAKPLQSLEEVRAMLRQHYVKPVDDKRLTQDAIRGMLKALGDPYSEYLNPEELEQMQRQHKATLTGIGVQIRVDNGRVKVLTPLEGSPALKAGLRPDDEIAAVDGKPTAGVPLAEVVKRILGPRGKVVKLKVVHPDGVVKDVAIPRGEVRVRTVEGFRRGDDDRWQYLLDGKHKVGYARILYFVPGTAAELRAAIEGLQPKGLKGLILDLRSCPGGLLDQAVGVCRLFLKDGKILTTRGADKKEHVFEADGKDHLGDFPLVVLLNEETASAAEIVAGALRDRGRAVLVGARSFGKGSVSSILDLKAGGALKLTTAYHYLPSGRNIQKRPGEKNWGVDPTEGDYLPLTAEQTEALRKAATKRYLLGLPKGERPKWTEPVTPKVLAEEHADPQLAAALRTMVARLTGGEFIKVGRPGIPDDAARLEQLRGRREELLRDLRRLEGDIEALQQPAGKGPKSPPK
jgi:carboxyl-terminal processing protease